MISTFEPFVSSTGRQKNGFFGSFELVKNDFDVHPVGAVMDQLLTGEVICVSQDLKCSNREDTGRCGIYRRTNTELKISSAENKMPCG